MWESIEYVVQETVQEVIPDLDTAIEMLGAVTSPGFLETPELVQVKVHLQKYWVLGQA